MCLGDKPVAAALLSKWSRLTPKRRLLGASIAIVIVAGIIAFAVLFLVRAVATPSDKSDEHTEVRTVDNITLSGKLTIIDRNTWLAQPFIGTMSKLKTPVEYVIISHSASEPCSKQAECTFSVRKIQKVHVENYGWQDIAYNFLVGGDGYVYTGRGWDYVGAHTNGWNTRSIGINLIGTFNSTLPSKQQILALQQIIELGVELGKIVKDYKLLAYCQLSASSNPESALYKEMQKWPHWKNFESHNQNQDEVKKTDEHTEVLTRFQSVDNNVTPSGKLTIIDRNTWLAQPFIIDTMSKLKTPVEYVIISHSESEPCSKQAECTFLMRKIQTFHILGYGLQDIAYNFLVGGDGYVYTGHGWDYVGAHTYGWNTRSIGINLIGTFISTLPPKQQILALQQLIELGIELGKIVKDYKLLAHRQLSASDSPGFALFEEMKKWPHWKKCDTQNQKQAEIKIPVC